MADSEHQGAVHTEEVLERLDYGFPGNGSGTSASPTVSKVVPHLWRLWESRRLLARVAWRTLLVSTLIVFLIPVEYKSTTRFMPSDQGQSGGPLLAALAGSKTSSAATASSSPLLGIAGDVLGMKSPGALYVALLHSRTVQANLVRRFNLQKIYSRRYESEACKALESNTEVTEDRKSGVITLIVTDHDKNRAQGLAQAYIEELNQLLSQVSASSGHRERVFIEQRLTQVKKDLEDAETRFSVYASRNTALDIPEQTHAMVEAAAVLQGEFIAAQSELEGLEQIYTPNNVRVRSLQARVGELQKQLEQIGGSDLAFTTGEPSAMDSQQLYPPIRKLPLLGVEWANLYRNVRVEETVFELLTGQYEMARLQEARDTPVVSSVDSANLPERKSFPPRLLLIFVATFLSLLITSFILLWSDRWQQVDEDDPRKLLVRTVFGSFSNQWKKSIALMPFGGFLRRGRQANKDKQQ
jgi:capsule polysaccharide export protein KpsE/RkpR